MTLYSQLLARLDDSIADLWARASASDFWRQIVETGYSSELYRVTMVQIFHYTRHNSINQAVAAFRTEPGQMQLLRYAYGHAKDELGHENMILHDLKSIGLMSDGEVIDPPLPATDALINYLYGIALREGATARLGYSYWAESSYEHVGPLLVSAKKSLGLTDRNMTFFVAHSEIDQEHVEQVRAAIGRAVTTPEQADSVHRVAVTSLWLTIQLLAQAFEAANGSRRFA
jgi:pyrroloquinoline quinone (PQQ) biosynthesis protein C